VKPPEEDRFEIDIFWSDEDDAYIAVVPDIPSCTAWGDTYEEALKEIRTAIRGNIEVAREFGHTTPQPKARQVS
jgi:antitoxin HicB